MLSSFDGVFWFVVVLLPLVFLQRFLHREIQAVFLILTRNPALTVGLFSILFFPGVLLHELSHYLMARVLGVQTGGFSIFPQATPEGRLQLGYVETVRTDLARDALIGAAPVVTGGLFVAYAAIHHLQLMSLWEVLRSAQFDLFWQTLAALPQTQDFPLWFYLTFAISSTMLPSDSDRHAWLPLGLLAGVLVALAALAGAGAWMLSYLAPPLNNFLRAAATLLGLSAAVHLAFVLPIFLMHRLLTQITGVDIR
ncbi:MAG TPA: hypothetical protein VGJ22_14965 [Anaerolineales bacterium]